MPEERPTLSPPELEELQELRAKDKRTFSVDMDKKVVIAILTIVFGGGGYSGWQLVTKAQLDEKAAEIKAEAKEERKTLSKNVQMVSAKVDTNTETIQAVQEVQHMDIAVREARRVVDENIKCRRGDNGCEDRKDREKERVRRLNMARLGAKKKEDRRPPCADLACN